MKMVFLSDARAEMFPNITLCCTC